MTRAPATLRPPHQHGHRPTDLLGELRTVLARAHHLDPEQLRRRAGAPVAVDARFDLLGEARVRTGADALARLDALARELVTRMNRACWASGAVPETVTSVLAASVPEAEAVLLRVARRRAARFSYRGRPAVRGR